MGKGSLSQAGGMGKGPFFRLEVWERAPFSGWRYGKWAIFRLEVWERAPFQGKICKRGTFPGKVHIIMKKIQLRQIFNIFQQFIDFHSILSADYFFHNILGAVLLWTASKKSICFSQQGEARH